MGHLPTAVALGDVVDVDAFVNAFISGEPRWQQLRECEREELEGEGFLVMCELWDRYTSRGPWSTFEGYASEFLPRRLLDRWHRLHRGEHIRRPNQNGHRVWEYRVISSLEAALEDPRDPEFEARVVRRLAQFERPPALAAA